MKENIQIRQMTIGDAGAAALLEAECFSMPWSEKAYRETLAGKDAYYVLAEVQAKQGFSLIGTCGMLEISGEADISNVAVLPGYRNQGIGGQLLSRILKEGQTRGIMAYTLEVRSSNRAAIALYEKFGFRTEGVRKNFYRNPTEDALIMWLRK